MNSKQSKGGQVTAKKLRTQALINYYKNPTICKNCNNIVNVLDSESPAVTKRKTFCSRNCAAIYNNSKRIKKQSLVIPKLYKRNEPFAYIVTKTKKEIFDICKNWQSTRTQIRKHAVYVFYNSSIPKKCKICGYNKHIQIAHIKAVKFFDDDVLITTINHIDNLIALCPNHHWEFDNNMLS